MSRGAKIVCTLGPATSSPEQIAALVAAGLDVARLNMSHGDHGAHRAAYDAVRAAADASGRSVGVLVDLQGPKIRLGRFASGPVVLAPGQEFTITGEHVPGDQGEVSVSYQGLAGDVWPGTTLLVDDGRVVLEVTAVQGPAVRTRVVVGGPVSDHKGLNLPGVRVSVPALTSKDADDLRFALGLRADMVALSFVQGPEDIGPVRKIMDEAGVRLPVIAKIEKPQAVTALEEVVAAFDGIMVARGDLGVELPLEQVPLVQKRAIRLARCRSPIPLLAFTTEPATRSQLALTWGAEPFLVPPVEHTDDMVRQVEVALRDVGRCAHRAGIVSQPGRRSPRPRPVPPRVSPCAPCARRPRSVGSPRRPRPAPGPPG